MDMASCAGSSKSAERDKTFLLESEVQFGYHPVCSSQVTVSDDGLSAEKRDPTSYYAHGVAYGAKPLRGTAEFEVEILSYGTGWSGTLKLGVMRCKTGGEIQQKDIPRYSPEASDHCVWSSDKMHNRLDIRLAEKSYGYKNLDELRSGDRLGMRLSHDGVLVFFVNGIWQGVAAEKVYEKGYDVYPVIDHYANCKATKITRAGEEWTHRGHLVYEPGIHFSTVLPYFSIYACKVIDQYCGELTGVLICLFLPRPQNGGYYCQQSCPFEFFAHRYNQTSLS